MLRQSHNRLPSCVHPAVSNDRRRLLLTIIGNVNSPGLAKFPDVCLFDLRQRCEAIAGVSAGGENPIAVVGLCAQERARIRRARVGEG